MAGFSGSTRGGFAVNVSLTRQRIAVLCIVTRLGCITRDCGACRGVRGRNVKLECVRERQEVVGIEATVSGTTFESCWPTVRG